MSRIKLHNNNHALLLFIKLILIVSSRTIAFQASSSLLQKNRRVGSGYGNRRNEMSSSILYGSPRPIHTKFTVEKATPEKMNELGVTNWPTWSTEDSTKYKVGIKSPLKVYDCNELSYIIEGDMDIIPKDTGIPVPVKAGDFVTFPDGFECYWYVKEVINKHWYIY